MGASTGANNGAAFYRRAPLQLEKPPHVNIVATGGEKESGTSVEVKEGGARGPLALAKMF